MTTADCCANTSKTVPSRLSGRSWTGTSTWFIRRRGGRWEAMRTWRRTWPNPFLPTGRGRPGACRAELGYDLAVTHDGPKGPRYVVQKGVIALAQVTGLPIIPVTCNTERKICLQSWGGFQIPLPFSICELILNQPIFVRREACEAEREEMRMELEASLRASSRD